MTGIQLTDPVDTVVLLVTVESDNLGRVTRTFKLPSDALPGTYTVVVTQAGLLKAITFQVTR